MWLNSWIPSLSSRWIIINGFVLTECCSFHHKGGSVWVLATVELLGWPFDPMDEWAWKVWETLGICLQKVCRHKTSKIRYLKVLEMLSCLWVQLHLSFSDALLGFLFCKQIHFQAICKFIHHFRINYLWKEYITSKGWMVIRNQYFNRDKYGLRASHVWLAQYQKLSTTSVLEQIIICLFCLDLKWIKPQKECWTAFIVFCI